MSNGFNTYRKTAHEFRVKKLLPEVILNILKVLLSKEGNPEYVCSPYWTSVENILYNCAYSSVKIVLYIIMCVYVSTKNIYAEGFCS